MKTLILFLLFTCITNAQSYTEKYNSFQNRYEYFNSNGTLVGYKYYDSFNQQWVYKDLNEKPKSTYVNPINTELLNKVMAKKQNSIDNNVQKIQNIVDDIYYKIQKLDLDKDVKKTINNRFESETLKFINSKKYNYSSNSITNQIINYLYSEINKIIKEETN